MLGKTHMMVGTAAVLAVTRPDTVSGIVTAAGVGALGALISDIDVGTSASHKDADKVIQLTLIVTALAVIADFVGNLGLIQRIMSNSGITRIIIGWLMFIGICAFGKEQPHRSFMHSLLALVLLSFSIGLIYVPIVPYFAVGFLSHIATDIFNKRKLRLLYPLKGGVSFNLFRANGTANSLFFAAGCIVTAVELVLLLLNIFIW